MGGGGTKAGQGRASCSWREGQLYPLSVSVALPLDAVAGICPAAPAGLCHRTPTSIEPGGRAELGLAAPEEEEEEKQGSSSEVSPAALTR